MSSIEEESEFVEGWLHIWDTDHNVERHVFCAGRHPEPRWEPRFCILSCDNRTFTCYEYEQADSDEEELDSISESSSIARHTRLDGGKGYFHTRWGYRVPKKIKEQKILPEPLEPAIYEEDASAESFFRTRTTLNYHNESLPDLASSPEDYSKSSDKENAANKNTPASNDSSLERVDGERRGSLPLVSTYNESMESVSTTSRLANFFSKKGFRSNLKRTKSATKLDRKRSSPNLSEHDSQDTSSLMGSLKRTMSLGRLSRKKGSKSGNHKPLPYASSTPSRQSTPHDSPALSLINARIRSSRSHESLLASPPSMHSIDLSAPDVEVKPLHSSVLGQGHCFHVATSQGSKYISCTTSEERDKWLSSLRRTIRPHEEHCKRSDSSLKLWIVEAKNVPAKKRYFCDILLDKTLYAQTSIKTMTDMLFWGEHFEFKNLPAVEIITVNLYREADKKKKKDKNTLVGYINLYIADFENRQLIERWITCSSGTVGKAGKETKSELPIIRLKARRQTVDILPLDAYQSFIKYLTCDYKQLCQLFEPLLAVREKEDFATSLVYILQKQGKACEFLSDIVMEEISRLDDEHLTFRGNSIATKAMEAYMKLVGEKYLQDTLGDFIRQLVQSTDDCEVDPTKVATPQLLACQQKNLDMYSNMAWVKIINSFCFFPNELREVFASFRSRCDDRGKGDYSDNLISGCIFLRFLCPAILYPSLFNLTQEYPNERASRNLTLIAKTIQTLANFTQFGGKEEFMTFMNTFVEREAPNMKTFLHKISSREASNQFLEFDGYIDLGKELSVLQALLLECMEKYSENTGKPFEDLSKILNSLAKASEEPSVGQKKPNNRKSQIYDNLVHISSPSKEVPQSPLKITHGPTKMKNMTASSPTEVLIDMLRHCGESADDLPALANRSRSSETSPGVVEGTVSSSTQTSTSVSTTRTVGVREVGNVSVIGPRQVYNEHTINESWTQMVTAADTANGDYIDLIPFVDEEAQNSSMEMDGNTTGSQVSIGQLSTVASSGYQSFSHSHSQSNSPVDSSVHPQQGQELTREITRSPIIYYQPNQSPQPLAFANPLFRHQQQHHQQQSARSTPRAGVAAVETHHGIPYSQAKTVQRVSSDSSLSSEEGDGGGTTGPKSRPPPFVKTTSATNSVSSDYQSSIAPLKKLSQLSSSGSEDSLAGQSASNSSSLHSSTNFVHSTSANFISQPSSIKPSSVMSSMANSAMNGCSTFPRRHRNQQQDQTGGNDISPPIPPREAIGVNSSSSTPGSHRAPGFHRQMSNPSSGNVQPSRQPPRPFPPRAGITTTKTGHVQQRKVSGGNLPPFLSSDAASNTQSKPLNSQHSSSSSPAIPPRGFHSGSSSNNSSSYPSPATHHRLDGGSHSNSPATYRANKNRNSNTTTNTTTSVTTAMSGSFAGQTVTHKPPVSTSTTSAANWQVAHHLERSSSSQETSSSSDSSPQSLVRSAQNNTSSMHESSSAHSISSAPSSSQPWGYTPSQSDSNSSLSSLTKTHQRAPVRSDSSGSLGGINVSRISQTPSDSNSSVSSGNNNSSSGFTTSTITNQLDNRGHYQGQANPSFHTRLSSISDSQINNLSLQTNPLPSPPAFLTSKYAVVHPHSTNTVGSPHSERNVPLHSNSESKSGTNSRTSYTASRSMDLGYVSKQRGEPMKRASTDSTLSQASDGLSPTGPGPSWPRDEPIQSGSSSGSNAANRRLSPQSTVHMGISSVQRKLQEQERTKQEYEQEVHVLRQQLLEAQERLQQAEMRLLDHEFDTHKLMDEWQNRLVESEEKMRRQQAEKDEQMKTIISRLQTIEEELKKEQAEMASAVEHKQQVIEVQEQRIRKLDEANSKLLQALADLKGRAARAAAAQSQDENSNSSSTCNGLSNTREIAGFKTSSC